jgi:hypothetical protein
VCFVSFSSVVDLQDRVLADQCACLRRHAVVRRAMV